MPRKEVPGPVYQSATWCLSNSKSLAASPSDNRPIAAARSAKLLSGVQTAPDPAPPSEPVFGFCKESSICSHPRRTATTAAILFGSPITLNTAQERVVCDGLMSTTGGIREAVGQCLE